MLCRLALPVSILAGTLLLAGCDGSAPSPAASAGHEALMAARGQLPGMAAQEPTLMAVRPNGREDEPQCQAGT